MPDDRKYVRVYYSIQDDPKFDRVRGDVAILGTWLRLLMNADAAWPASADMPRWVRKSWLDALVAAELIDVLPGHRYRVHGLDAERNARRNAASNAAASRWHSNGNAPRNAESMPSKAKQSREEQRLTKDVDNPSREEPFPARPRVVGEHR